MMTRCNYSVQTALRSLDPDGAMEVWLGCNGVMSGDSLPLGCVWILRGLGDSGVGGITSICLFSKG